MLMPRALQAKLPRIFGEPEEEAATGESIWGMITKSEDGPELATRPAEREAMPETAAAPSPSERLLSTMAKPVAISKADIAADRLLSSINQIPAPKERAVPRRAGAPFPARPKGERPVRPPKVTIQKPGASTVTTKKALFETPLILEAKDVQPQPEAKAPDPLAITPPPSEIAKTDSLSFEPRASVETSQPPQVKLPPIWRSDVEPGPTPSKAPAAQSSVLWQSDASAFPSAPKSSSGWQPRVEPPIAKGLETHAPSEEAIVKPTLTPLDWGEPAPERPSVNDALFPPNRPTIKFSQEASRPMGADHDLLHTPFVIRRSRRRKAAPIVLIAAGTLAFVLLNGVALYYMPKLLGERQAPLPMKGFISEPNVVATNAPAMQPVTSPAADPASTSESAPAATAAAAPPVAKAPEIAVAPSPVVPAPAVKPAPELREALSAAKAPIAPEPKLKPALRDNDEVAAKSVVAKAAPVKAAPVKAAPVKAAAAAVAATPVVTAKAAPVQEAAPSATAGDAPTASDGVLVQIGAYASTGVADKGWRDVSAALPAEMAGKTRRTQPIPKGDATLYRTMVAGFSDRGKAAQFCSDLKEKGLACFVRP